MMARALRSLTSYTCVHSGHSTSTITDVGTRRSHSAVDLNTQVVAQLVGIEFCSEGDALSHRQARRFAAGFAPRDCMPGNNMRLLVEAVQTRRLHDVLSDAACDVLKGR